MNAKQINEQIRIVDFLNTHGFQPVSNKGSNFWYISMIRNKEAKASFKVDQNKNLWFDHGIGVGGTLVDLACRIFKTDNIKEVINLIQNDFSSFHQQPIVGSKAASSSQGLRIVSTSYLKDPRLKAYLYSRAISIEIANKYCKELTYVNNEREFKSIAFMNNSNGYELRSKDFKSCYNRKNITFIDNTGSRILVFEGFMDFLSYLMLPIFEVQNADYLILNSLALLGRTTPYLANNKLKYLFLDNDAPGIKAVGKIKNSYPNCIDMGIFYGNYKDLNDFLILNQKPNDKRIIDPTL